MVQPFSPAEAKTAQQNLLPDEVIEVVNSLLAQRSGTSSSIRITQPEVVTKLEALGFEKSVIFAQHLLDFEGRFEAAGWKIQYDKPTYDESYDPYWIFEPRG